MSTTHILYSLTDLTPSDDEDNLTDSSDDYTSTSIRKALDSLQITSKSQPQNMNQQFTNVAIRPATPLTSPTGSSTAHYSPAPNMSASLIAGLTTPLSSRNNSVATENERTKLSLIIPSSSFPNSDNIAYIKSRAMTDFTGNAFTLPTPPPVISSMPVPVSPNQSPTNTRVRNYNMASLTPSKEHPHVPIEKLHSHASEISMSSSISHQSETSAPPIFNLESFNTEEFDSYLEAPPIPSAKSPRSNLAPRRGSISRIFNVGRSRKLKKDQAVMLTTRQISEPTLTTVSNFSRKYSDPSPVSARSINQHHAIPSPISEGKPLKTMRTNSARHHRFPHFHKPTAFHSHQPCQADSPSHSNDINAVHTNSSNHSSQSTYSNHSIHSNQSSSSLHSSPSNHSQSSKQKFPSFSLPKPLVTPSAPVLHLSSPESAEWKEPLLEYFPTVPLPTPATSVDMVSRGRTISSTSSTLSGPMTPISPSVRSHGSFSGASVKAMTVHEQPRIESLQRVYDSHTQTIKLLHKELRACESADGVIVVGSEPSGRRTSEQISMELDLAEKNRYEVGLHLNRAYKPWRETGGEFWNRGVGIN